MGSFKMDIKKISLNFAWGVVVLGTVIGGPWYLLMFSQASLASDTPEKLFLRIDKVDLAAGKEYFFGAEVAPKDVPQNNGWLECSTANIPTGRVTIEKMGSGYRVSTPNATATFGGLGSFYFEDVIEGPTFFVISTDYKKIATQEDGPLIEPIICEPVLYGGIRGEGKALSAK